MSQSTPNHLASEVNPSKLNEGANKSTFSLQVVSPSFGVPQALEFHELSVNMQVKELKNLIRDSLLSSPPDELQRLIHRGRMLVRETETMLEIFGDEMLRNPGFHIIHLVLRPSPEHSGTVSSIDMKETNKQSLSVLAQGPQIRTVSERPIISPLRPGLAQAQSLLPSSENQQQTVLRQVEALQTLMGQRLQQLQRDTQRLNQEINTIESQGLLRTNTVGFHTNSHGIQHGAPELAQSHLNSNKQNQLHQHQNPHSRGSTARGTIMSMSSQESSNTQRSDQLILNGEQIKPHCNRRQAVDNETFMTVPDQSITSQIQTYREPSYDLRSILRNTERTSVLDISNSQNSSTVSASEDMKFISSSPLISTSTGAATPVTLSSVSNSSTGENSGSNTNSMNATTGNKPLVYILSSPTGPRAILMSSTQNFFTPSRNPSRNRYTFGMGSAGINPAASAEYRIRSSTHHQARNPNEDVAEPEIAAPQANLRLGGMGIQIWQVLWLIIRLVGFFWFFTAGNPSWTRWLMASGLATVVFIVLTGILNGVVEQFWNPIRRHLDTLVPLGPALPNNLPLQPNGIPAEAGNDQPIQPRPTTGATNQNINEWLRGELNPTGVASREVEQRIQTNSEWFKSQIRRLEQALILFVASLVPGVSERHIAHREAQANREVERQQQIFEAMTEQATQVNTENTVSRQMEDGENSSIGGQNPTDNFQDQENVPQPVPLVQI